MLKLLISDNNYLFVESLMGCLIATYRGIIIVLTFILIVCHLLMILSGIGNILSLFYFANDFKQCDAKIFIWLVFQSVLYVINVKTNNFLLIFFQIIVYGFGWLLLIQFDCEILYYVNNLIYFQQVILSVMLVSILVVLFFTLIEINSKGFDGACKSHISLAWIAITKFRWLKGVNKIKSIFVINSDEA